MEEKNCIYEQYYCKHHLALEQEYKEIRQRLSDCARKRDNYLFVIWALFFLIMTVPLFVHLILPKIW